MAGNSDYVPHVTPQSAPLDPFGMRSGEPTVSKLRFYSIGLVAANKALNSKEIEVCPVEELPMLDGELSDATQLHQASGVNASGQDYSSQVKMANSIKAMWLPFCDAQRLTAPDVRRGETVVIYQIADADRFYWTTLKNDNKLRKLETVVWAFSGTKKEGDDLTPETSYFFEVSTHKKLITLHTSQADGEAYGYDIQINPKESKIVIIDTAGNKLFLNTPEQQWHVENSAGAFVDITKKVITISAADKIEMDTKDWIVNSTNATTNTTTSTINASSVHKIVTPFIDAP